MKVLVIGSGGREHAIAWKLAQSSLADKIYCAPGNGGTSTEKKCENINLTKSEEFLNFALKHSIDITIVGPEAPLVEGIVDLFKEKGLRIFGPSKETAKLEGSKAYAKEFMKKYNVKTAAYEVFIDYYKALEYIKLCSYPVVIKADGLAAGKGVAICRNFEQAKKNLEQFMLRDIFKGAGKKIVIEEYLEGTEASILVVTDGNTMLPLISAKDHKTIYDNNMGENTGGMGVICPNPYFTEEAAKDFELSIMKPTLEGINAEKLDYKGIVFFGIMITKNGVYLLEYNVRMGDPETQAVLSLLESDFMELILKTLDKDLENYNIVWKKGAACCVIAASSGYPKEYITGYPIEGVNECKSKVFISGAYIEDNKLITSGGRVLGVTAAGNSLKEAADRAYRDINKINFTGMHYRKDIGR